MSDPHPPRLNIPAARFRLRYHWLNEPQYEKNFLTLAECREHVRDVVQRPVDFYDRAVRAHGTLYPSGDITWNRSDRDKVRHLADYTRPRES